MNITISPELRTAAKRLYNWVVPVIPVGAAEAGAEVVHSSAYEAGHVLLEGAGTLLKLSGFSSKGSSQFIQLHDLAAVPSDAVAEVFTVDFTGATAAGLSNKYLLTEDAAGSVYIWFNLDASGVDPAPAGVARGISVGIATGDTDAQMAAKFETDVHADAAFNASTATALVTVTNAATGVRTDAAAGNSGLTVATTVQGITAAVPLDLLTSATVANFAFNIPPAGIPFTNGIVVCNSTTGPTKTAGSADCFFTAVIAPAS